MNGKSCFEADDIEQLGTGELSSTAIISPRASIGKNCKIGHFAVINDNVELGDNCVVENNVTLGHPLGNSHLDKNYENPKTIIGKNSIIRTNSVIYCGVRFAENVETGTNVVIREHSSFDSGTFISTLAQVQNNSTVGRNVNIRTNAHITANMIIEDNVFVGAGVVTTNDNKLLRKEDRTRIQENQEQVVLQGPVLRKGARVGSNCTILPNVEIGEGSIIAAGSVVRKSIGAQSIAGGNPAVTIRKLQE